MANNVPFQRHGELWGSSKFALFEDERGDEAKYEKVRGGHVAIFENFAVRAKDEFEIAMVPQCSSYCMSQENGDGSQLQLIVQQWSQNVVVKEDAKQIKIASDLRKQV